MNKKEFFVLDEDIEGTSWDIEGDRDRSREDPVLEGDPEEGLARAEFIARYLASKELGVQLWFVRGLLGELEREWKYKFSCEGVNARE